jgi:hypothetical protein
MLLSVVYGIYAVFFENKIKEPTIISATKELENLNAFITKVAEASKAGLSKEDTYIISRAEAKWKQDPLINAELTDRPIDEIKRKTEVQVVDPQLKVTYTGFMQMGDKKFAIINGIEYASGDELEQGGYIVRKITPSQVTIVRTGRIKKSFIFPLEE